MNILKSWRWSRLTEPSAFERLVTHPQWFVPLITSLLLLWLVNDPSLKLPEVFSWLCWLCWIILGVAILQSICCADEFYEIKLGDKIIRKIYLYTAGYYKQSPKINMIILEGDYEIHHPIESNHYRFFEGKEFTSFLFVVNGNYYYSSPVHDGKYLGTRLTSTIFSPTEEQLIVLNGSETMTLNAENFFLNNAYIPPLAAQRIYDEVSEEKLEKPQDYLITKQGKTYTVYGLYHRDSPACRRLVIPNIIFREGSQDVILQWNESKGYLEIFRSHNSIKRHLSDVFIELTFQNGIGGTIRKFNEKDQKLDLLYKGEFRTIDFDSGHILGDNGYEFLPDS